MGRFLREAAGLATLLILGSGCGSSTPTPEKAALSSADAGPNSRLKFKDEYKKMLDKDGKMLFKPSESNKRPPGVPKS